MKLKKPSDKKSTFSTNDIFGVSQERADEIINAFRYDSHKKWGDTLESAVKKSKPKTDGECAFFGYIFGRLYEKEHTSIEIITSGMITASPIDITKN